MRTAIVVQARMGSSRLPGKVMQMIGDRPVLVHVLERCRRVQGCESLICAVPDHDASLPLIQVAHYCGAQVYRGSEHDVLSRYLGAARAANIDVVMRVTSDCPLIDPRICESVLALRARANVDYAANNMPPSFPHGLDCEAFTTAALAEADRSTQAPYDREHVTPWLRRASHLKRINLRSERPDLDRYRWTLDYPEDLAFFRAVFEALPADSKAETQDILDVLASNPQLNSINAKRRVAAIQGA